MWFSKLPSKRNTRTSADVFVEHGAYVYRCLRARGLAESEAQDALQEVFMVVHRKADKLAGIGALKPWLYQIAFNVVREHRRKHARQKEDLEKVAGTHEEHLIDECRTPEQQLGGAEAQSRLKDMLNVLNEEQREVFWLIEVEDLTPNEVAEALGTSVNNVYSRHRRAKEELQRLMPRLRSKAQATGILAAIATTVMTISQGVL